MVPNAGRYATRVILVAVLVVAAAGPGTAQQTADTSYHPPVPRPAYALGRGPRPLFDHAHHNFHRIDGRFRPFAELATGDGYRVSASDDRLTGDALAAADILVIVNARGGEEPLSAGEPAFTPAERAAVRDWVRAGGALLLVADHAPFGAAAESLAVEFGVVMGKGFTLDPSPGRHDGENPSLLVFSQVDHLLGDHAILRGRDSTEAVGRVVTFTGQSLTVPDGAVPLLVLSPTAMDRPPPTREANEARAARLARLRDSLAGLAARGVLTDSVIVTRPAVAVESRGAPTPAAGRAQGVALAFGRGRVVVLGSGELP
jgi:hypothetical protein